MEQKAELLKQRLFALVRLRSQMESELQQKALERTRETRELVRVEDWDLQAKTSEIIHNNEASVKTQLDYLVEMQIKKQELALKN